MLSFVFLIALAAQGGTPPGDPPPSPAPPVDEAPVAGPRPIEPREQEPAASPEPAAGDGSEASDDGDEPEDSDADDGIEVGPAEADENRTLMSQSRITLGGRLGAAAGNVFAVPFFLPGPGAFLTGTHRLLAFELAFVDADAGLSLGINENGDLTSLAGYKARLGGGVSLSLDVLTFEADLHAGLTSVALLPVPRMGVGGALKLALPVTHFMTLDGEARADLDLLLIVPAPAASIEGGATIWLGEVFFVRMRAGLDCDAVIAVVANTISASVFLSLTAGLNLTLLD